MSEYAVQSRTSRKGFVITKMFPQAILVVLVVVASVSCYTLKPGIEIAFPVQFEITNDAAGRFQRYNKHDEFEILSCPDGFTFDNIELKCKYSREPQARNQKLETMACNANGPNAFPMNCRNFVNCFDGIGYVQTCNAHLLFNSQIRNCDWPERSNCCEYKTRS